MTPDQLKQWRKHSQLSQTQACEVMGCGRRTYQGMERGGVEIRNCHALAAAAWATGLRGWDDALLEKKSRRK